jgi:DNA invertase Pin-like site-specific DNA recombinase
MVERGRVQRGSYLIIENLDRLSREDERAALRLWMDILDAGINIVQLVPETVFRHEKSDMVDIMRAIIELSRGHSESRIKSERLTAVWGERKRRAREEGETLTPTLPGWIEDRDGKRYVKPGAKAAIKRIFQLAARGYGEILVTRLFKKNGVPHFGNSGVWTQSYVRKLLRDRRLLGEFQPRIKETGEPDGELIPNYFPAVLSEAEFYAAQRGRDGRKTVRKDATPVELQTVSELHQQGETVAEIARQLGVNRNKVYRALIKLGLKTKPAGDKPHGVYLFAGMVKALWDDRRYVLGTWISMNRPYKILLLKGQGSTTFPYAVFERALLHELREIDPKEILEGANGHNEVVALEGEYGALEAEIEQINADMDVKGFSPTLGKRARKLEERLAEVARQLRAAQEKAANPLSAAWGEAKTLLAALDSAADQEDARVRLRAALKRIIARIGMQVVAKGRTRLAFVNIEFTGEHANRFRTYTICYRPRPKGGWRVNSVAGDVNEAENYAAENPEALTDIEQYLLEWHDEAAVNPAAWQALPE